MNLSDELYGREVRGLWLKEPFATLTAFHGKVETRSWSTNYRGLVLICSSLKPFTNRHLFAMCGDALCHDIRKRVQPEGKSYGSMPQGGVAVCLTQLVEVRKLQEHDTHFINWRSGPYWATEAFAWIFDDVIPVKPVPLRGQLGMPRLSDEIKAQIERL